MNDLENKMKDALITCHVLLSVQWNELGEQEQRCRSDRKRENIRHIRNQIQTARKMAGNALRDAGAMKSCDGVLIHIS